MTRPFSAARLQQLIASNRAKPRRYEIETAASGSEATVYIYDTIDPFFGVTAAQFVKDLAAITASTIHLRINSPGGDVFDGRAIATAVRAHKARVIAHVDGLAASAASFIALAADEVEMAPGSMMMIHRASAIAWGTADELRALAVLLEKIDAALITEYATETGNSEADVAAWLDAETWFTADEAVEHGFADRIAETATKVENAWDLTAYGRPAAAMPAPDDSGAASDDHYRRILLDRLIPGGRDGMH